MIRGIVLLIITMCLHSCSLRKYNPDEYVKWIEHEENGLRVKRALGNFDFILQYKPVNYLIAQELQGNSLTEDLCKKRTEELKQALHFNLIIRSADQKTNALLNGTSTDGYFKRISYFLSSGQEDFKLRVGKDTLNCSFCHLEQNYGLAPQNTIVLAFETRGIPLDHENDIVFIYDDKVFDTGIVKMKIEKRNLDQIPEMKMN